MPARLSPCGPFIVHRSPFISFTMKANAVALEKTPADTTLDGTEKDS
jgi:hypothetical protein